MRKKRPAGDSVQVSAWIPRVWKPLLEALGGPSELLRDSIEKRGGKKAKLIALREDWQRTIDKANRAIKEIDALLEEMERTEEAGSDGSGRRRSDRAGRKSRTGRAGSR